MSAIDLTTLLEAASPGGATCLTSRTELEPAGGPQTTVAPAKFALRGRDGGAYAYETRYLDAEPARAVLIDSKQSVLNRCEAALSAAIGDGHPVLSRLPRIEVRYERNGAVEEYSDLSLPHRAFDGHIRAGSVDGTPVTQLEQYRALRNATPGNARVLLDVSPVTLVFGGWDSSRSARQGRWRSILVGEVVGFCADDDKPGLKGGARVDPVGMRIELTEAAMRQLATDQRAELSRTAYDKAFKGTGRATSGGGVSGSMFGLGGIPPTLEALAGVACHRIVRSHVLSFAALRQLRFGAGPDGDAACRALLAALALAALARSDAELVLRANCDLREAGPVTVELDARGGQVRQLDGLTISEADTLLQVALAQAEATAGVEWTGPVMTVTGNPAVVAGAGAGDEDLGEEA